MAPSIALMMSIELYLKPVYKNSKFLNDRHTIKTCRPLNKLLYENRNGLEFIYNHLKGQSSTLSKRNAHSFINRLLTGQHKEFTLLEIHKQFVYSLETIADEHCDHEKYKCLNYIEFLEFISRIAMKLYDGNKEEGLDYKV